MAKMTRIRKNEYGALMQSVKRSGFQKSSILARLLLETWAFEDGQITSDWWTREKACAKGDFSKLRSSLIKDNWIVFFEDTKKYLPGIRLRPYLEKFNETRSATLADLAKINTRIDHSDAKYQAKFEEMNARKADREEVRDLRAQMHQIALAVEELQKAMLPPDTPEKKALREQRTAEIAKLSKTN